MNRLHVFRSLAIRSSLVLLLSSLVASVLPAQEPQPSSVFGDVLDVRVVNVEVVVTDRDGVRVLGLRPDLFRLLVDGEEQEIEFFTEVRGGVARPPAPDSDLRDIQIAEVQPGRAVGTSYLVFVDDFFSIERDRDQVLEDLRRQVAYLGPNDRMAIVAFDGRKLTMLTSWSQSHSDLQDVLRDAQQRPAYGRLRTAELRQLDLDEDRGRRSRVSNDSYYLDLEELYYAERIEEQLDRSVAAAASTLRGFGGPPGRKVMLLLSGGWPNHPAEFVVNDYHRAILDTQVRRGEGIFRPLTETANLLGYTLFPVDLPGFQGGLDAVDASRRGPAPNGGLSLRENDMHHTLEYLAEQTGGQPFINARRLDVMEEVHRDLAAYYWLGFTPERKGADADREIRVVVDAPGLTVRHRKGYQDYSRSTEVTMEVESALLFGHQVSEGPLSVQIGTGKRAGIGKVQVPIAVTIPLDHVTIVPYGDRMVGEVELRVAVQDESGQMAPIPVIRLRLDLEEPPPPGSTDRFETTMKLRKGAHDLVFSVHDPPSGRTLMATGRYEP